MGTERRKERRVEAKVIARCSLQQGARSIPQYFLGFTENLSYHGAHIISSRELAEGDVVLVGFEMTPTFAMPTMYCEVMWTRARITYGDEIRKLIDVGIKIVRMTPEEEQRLQRFIDEKEQILAAVV